MPYRPHSEYPSPYSWPPTPVKKRPSAAWFAVGGVLVLVAGIVFGVAIFRFVRQVSHADAVFPASGVHQVTLPAGTERAVFVPRGQRVSPCMVTTGTGGAPVQLRRPTDDFSWEDWVATRVFDTGDGNVTFTCPDHGHGQIRIGTVPSQGDLAALGFIGVLLPLALGGIGALILIVTTVLWIKRRPTPPLPGAPPGWQVPGWQPGSQPPGWQPGSQPPGWQPGSQPPGWQPGSQPPGSQSPGSPPPGGQPPGAQPPGAQPPGGPSGWPPAT
jgi:hypothetical protein